MCYQGGASVGDVNVPVAILKFLICRTSWNPLVPLGIPHRLMEDDYYRNFFIPTGATVLANILSDFIAPLSDGT